MNGTDHSDAPTASEVREHFDHDGPVVVIDAHRRSTAAWVRERWDGHVYEAEATVWAPHYVAIAASEKAYDKIRKESPDHWLVEARKAVAADGGSGRIDDLEHDQYGYYNDVPHALISLGSVEWHDAVSEALNYKLGPPIAWHYEGGSLHLWGENLDESLLVEIADACTQLEREHSDMACYDAAKSARRASSKISRSDVHAAGEVTVT